MGGSPAAGPWEIRSGSVLPSLKSHGKVSVAENRVTCTGDKALEWFPNSVPLCQARPRSRDQLAGTEHPDPRVQKGQVSGGRPGSPVTGG